MTSEKKNIEDKISQYLFKRDEILFAYLFGSFVRQENYHDIDIAIYLKENFDKDNYKSFPYGYESHIIGELNLLVKKNIDLVVTNNANVLIQKRIITQGKLLFSKDEKKRIYYENNVRKLFIDTENLRKIRRYYLSKI
ncbi:nucleotidyltransferase domain-containing protein [Melioribacteraceae bacterium 4301-Me]|uniref:type VII toxin-antitoxin system MntA family adenylyltransferase antitoxin n=1 Tax=Pyranulibacter aquaticus TaxID=3163344 RepID=UPI0035963988